MAKEKMKTNGMTIHIGFKLALFIGLIALIAGFIQGGWPSGLMVIPMIFAGMLGSLLGVIPFIGPLIYVLSVSTAYNALASILPQQIPVAQAILFYSNFAFSILYCFVISLFLIAFLITKGKLKHQIKAMKEANAKLQDSIKNITEKKEDTDV